MASPADEERNARISRYRKIEDKISNLTASKMKREYKAILEILDEGEILYPKEGCSIVMQLVRNFDVLYMKPTYSQLIKALVPSYQRSGPSTEMKKDLANTVWNKCIGFMPLFLPGCDLTVVIAKFKILLPLDADLSTSFLEKSFKTVNQWGMKTLSCLDLMTFLVREGAIPNPSHLNEATTAVTSYLHTFGSHQSLFPSLTAFLDATFNNWEVTNKNYLSDVIKGVPSFIFYGDDSHILDTRERIVKKCLNMIEMNPVLADKVDSEGKTPLHNIIEKLVVDGLWKRIPKLVAGTDNLWNLITKLITDKNINVRDKDQVTPYTWFLLWQDSISNFQPVGQTDNEEEWKNVEVKIKEIDEQDFRKKGARKEDAGLGLKSVLEKHLEALLRRLMTFHRLLDYQLKQSEKPVLEIIATFGSEIHKDIETVQHLKAKSCGECLAHLPQLQVFTDFIERHIYTKNEEVLKISEGILQALLSDSNAQEIYNNLFRDKQKREFSYIAFHDAVKQCIDKGARPTKDEVKSVLTMESFTNNEVLLVALQLTEKLIEGYRNNGNSDPIEIYLNPMQDLYKVSEELSSAAGSVVQAAYCTLSNCLNSKSVINTLLFLRSGVNGGDNETIKQCLGAADDLLQKDVRDSSVVDFLRNRKNHYDYKDELKEKLLHRNDSWLKRNVLHLIAIFIHSEKVLNYIPGEFIEEGKDKRDLHGCTPFHIAHLHDNRSLILLLESYQVKVVTDYFGRTPESFSVPYEYCEGDYTEYCQKILTTEYSVLDTMKEMLVLPVKECEAIEENFKELFKRMVAQDGFLNATVTIAGSVREKLKVGRFDEVDLQICVKNKPFCGETVPGLRLHEHLVKKMAEIEWDHISLRPVSAVLINTVATPWKFLWERTGRYAGLAISVDVVTIVKCDDALPYTTFIRPPGMTEEELVEQISKMRSAPGAKPGPLFIHAPGLTTEERQTLLIKDAPVRGNLELLKVMEFGYIPQTTNCMSEWDILDNLPPHCRLGILIVKALLEVHNQVSDHGFLKSAISSYVIKNTLFSILSGQTPGMIGSTNGNVIGERYGHLQQQLYFKGTRPTWTTEEDLESYGEGGRLWAETIFDAIHFLARNYTQKVNVFLENEQGSKPLPIQIVCDVLYTCEKCLECLRPCVFFNKPLTGKKKD